jgi:PAS domain S-box-containing protein
VNVLKVIIICDNNSNSNLFEGLLDNESFEIDFVHFNRIEFYFNASNFSDLLLIDVNSNYKWLTKSIISKYISKVPCIFIFNNSSEVKSIKEFKLSNYDFILKPLNKEELIARIRNKINLSTYQNNLYHVNNELEYQVRERTNLYKESVIKYRSLFEESPVSLFEEDISELVKLLNAKKKQGVFDLKQYIDSNPQFVYECLSKIKILKANKAALRIYSAKSVEHLRVKIKDTFNQNTITVFTQELISLFKDEFRYRSEIEYVDLKGKTFSSIIEFSTLTDNYILLVSITNINDLKITERALRESSKKLEEAQKVGKFGHWDLNLRNNYLELSEESKKIFDLNTHKITKYFLINLIHPEDRKFFKEKIIENRNSKLNTSFQFRIIQENKNVKYLYGTYKTIVDNGIPISAFGVIQDITSQKESEFELQKLLNKVENNEIKLNKILDTFEDGVYVCSDNFIIDYMNTPAINKAGKNILGKKCYKEIFGLSEQCDWCNFDKDGKQKSSKSKFNDPNTNKRFKVKSVLLESGSMLNILKDISKLEESEHKIRNLITAVEHSSSMIIITNSTGVVEYTNKKYREITGFSKDDIINRLLPIHDPQKTNRTIIAEMNKELSSGNEWYGEVLWGKKNGNTFWAKISKTPIFQNGEINSIITILEDITEQKLFASRMLNATVNAEEVERKKLAEDLHDELGPYLSVIKLNINQLRDEDFKKKSKNTILNNLDEMIDSSISITRYISNCLMPNILIDFGLIKALESFLKKIESAHKINIEFKYNLSRDLKLEKNVEIIIYRILIELINNSLKHSYAKNIRISFTNNKNVKICFSDDGIGFNLREKLNNKNGNGLLNILNRLKVIDGNYQFRSKPESGIYFKFEIKRN